MSKVEIPQLTNELEQAAVEFSGPISGGANIRERTETNTVFAIRRGFRAGAEWQKEQDKEILTALSTVYNEYMQSTKKDGKKPHMVTVNLNFQTMQHVATILNKHL